MKQVIGNQYRIVGNQVLNEVEPVEEREVQLLYHPNVEDKEGEELSFASIKDYNQYLSENGLMKGGVPRILITGMMGDATNLIERLEATNNVVYATRDLATLIKHKPSTASPLQPSSTWHTDAWATLWWST